MGRPLVRTLPFLGLVVLLISCGGGGIAPSLFNSNPPSGNLQVLLVGGNGSPVSSSLSAPIAVTSGFSLSIQEQHYTDTFTAQIVSWTAATTAPCFSTTTGSATVFTFTPVAAPAQNGSTTSPCGSADVEGVRFTDVRGNSTTAYYATGGGAVTGASGVVQALLVGGNGAALSTTPTSPLAVTSGFSINVQEANYSGAFTAQIVSWTAATTAACFATTTAAATVFTFTPVAAPALNGTTSPCGGTDTEGVRFTDTRGNFVTVYYATGTGTATGPSGIVVATLPGTTTPLTSSATAPIVVTNSFSIAAQESGYSGSFTASITSYTSPTVTPCYVVTGGNSIVQPNVFTFTPQNAVAVNGTTGACSLGGDVESVRIADNRGNSTTEYYAAGAAPATSVVTVSRIVLSIIGATPAGAVCGTYQVKVQTYDPTGSPVTSAVTYAYPVTVSIAGANNAALVTTPIAGLQPVCTVPPNAASTVSIATSASPVYVFLNGSQAAGATTLTATSFGVASANIGVLTF